jgi:hypothetical protein
MERVTCFEGDAGSLELLMADLPKYDAVILHCLDDFAIRLTAIAPKSTRFLWLSWGFDIYNPFPIFQSMLFQPETKAILDKMYSRGLRAGIKDAIKSELFRLGIPFSRAVTGNLRAIRRIQACATVLPDEWPIVRRLGFRGEFFRFNYGWLERLLPAGNPSARAVGPNILVGNSSTPACNHVEMFQLLAGLDLGDRKIITPLSYGDTTYKHYVLRHGRKLLGAAFSPIEQFMPIADYTKLLESCGTVILNHHRQQAVGNIIASIHMGAKVFLNECNPCHAFFSRIGVRLFSLQRDRVQLSRFDDGLADHIVQHNRSCLRSEYSKEVSLQRTRSIVQYLFAQGGT